MIHTALLHIVKHLNQYFKILYDLNEDIVVLSNIVEQDGGQNPYSENKIVVTLVNIEKETVMGGASINSNAPRDMSAIAHPAVRLNLFIMFSANFSGKNYEEALKYLSNTITFFQKNPAFTKETTPDLPENIEKLIFNIQNLGIHDLSNLWGVISSKYLPSILYKMRMITIDAEDVASRIPTQRRPALDAAADSGGG